MQSGLCESCKHSREVRAARSTFIMCELSRTDPTFARYPRLPVLRCRGYELKSLDRDEGDGLDGGAEP